MDLCTVEVQLGGSLNNTVVKQNVTPAEIVCLQQMHGVKLVSVDGSSDRNRVEEVKRLNAAYPKPMALAYPGAAPMIPMSITEIGLVDPEQVADEQARQRAEAKETVKQVQTKKESPARAASGMDPLEAMNESEALQLAGSDDTEDESAPKKKRGRPRKDA